MGSSLNLMVSYKPYCVYLNLRGRYLFFILETFMSTLHRRTASQFTLLMANISSRKKWVHSGRRRTRKLQVAHFPRFSQEKRWNAPQVLAPQSKCLVMFIRHTHRVLPRGKNSDINFDFIEYFRSFVPKNTLYHNGIIPSYHIEPLPQANQK